MENIRHEAIRIARLAGIKIKELREQGQLKESLKNGYEFVTTADLISNEIIKTEIMRIFHNHNIISEEDSECMKMSIENPTWIIDPIDGTVGYANNQYQVAVSITFAIDNEVTVGVVYNPFLDELFYVSENSGSFLNNGRIRIKDVSELQSSVVGTGFPHKKDDVQEIINRLGRVLPHIRDLRRLGSPALDICWVACGRMQGFYEEALHPWDVAAARLIAKEAGAQIGHYKESFLHFPECINGNSIIVSSPKVFNELKNLLV